MDANTVTITITEVPEDLGRLSERPDPDRSRAKDTWTRATVSASILLGLGRRGTPIPVDMLASIIAENVGPEIKMAQAEIARLRARVMLVAEDVADIEAKDIEAWLVRGGWTTSPASTPGHVPGDGRFQNWARPGAREWLSLFESSPSRWAECINNLGRIYGRPPLDILDEIRGAS